MQRSFETSSAADHGGWRETMQKMNGRTHHATTNFWSKPSSDEQVRMPKILFSTTFYENNPEKTWINLTNSSISLVLFSRHWRTAAARQGWWSAVAATTFQSRSMLFDYCSNSSLDVPRALVPTGCQCSIPCAKCWWGRRGFQRNPDITLTTRARLRNSDRHHNSMEQF